MESTADADYRGNVGVILFNHSDVSFPVKVGDRIAQLILERISTPAVVEVSDLPSSVRYVCVETFVCSVSLLAAVVLEGLVRRVLVLTFHQARFLVLKASFRNYVQCDALNHPCIRHLYTCQ